MGEDATMRDVRPFAASIVPSSQQPIASSNGQVTTPWQRFFNTLPGVQKAAPPVAAAPDGSPFSFTAGALGTVFIAGGTVSQITLTRYGTVVPTGATSGGISVANGDVVTVTYSGPPSINFVPA